MKPANTISSSYYLCVAGMYGYSIWYNLLFVRVGNSTVLTYDGYGGKFKYLTFWNLVRLVNMQPNTTGLL